MPAAIISMTINSFDLIHFLQGAPQSGGFLYDCDFIPILYINPTWIILQGCGVSES
jgi:hypothetical protein